MQWLPWWGWSLVANLAITSIEYLNRTQEWDSAREAISYSWPLILLAQIGLFYSWRFGPSMLAVWGFFFAGNVILRLASVRFLVGEPITPAQIAGVLLICVGATVMHVFRA